MSFEFSVIIDKVVQFSSFRAPKQELQDQDNSHSERTVREPDLIDPCHRCCHWIFGSHSSSGSSHHFADVQDVGCIDFFKDI